jgi:eukaryotic-like serine/threonine-protein kinase
MKADNQGVSERDSVLQQVIADYLLAEASGRPIDRAQWLADHAELAEELHAFFADHDQARRWAEPLCVAAPLTPAPAGDAATIDASGPAPTVAVPSAGRSFGDYEIIAEIARGGMGVVFRARQVSLNRVVALKMILAGQLAGAANIQRFHAEAEAAAHLDHPNIVPIYDVGVHDDQHFFSMKLVEGGNLTQISDFRLQNADWKTSQRQRVQLVATVASAVHYAHQRGILHRDLKPANILLSQQSAISNLQSAIPMVTDFGLAKRLTEGSAVTQTGSIVGTPSYMAPEQAAGVASLSTAVDVYSLGAILFELLTGRPPFRGESPLEVLRQVIDHEPPHPRTLNPAIDRDLEIICLKCLHKDPHKRYGSAEALAEDLERWLTDEPIQARAATRWEQAAKWAKRHKAAAALIGVSVMAPIVVLIVGLLYSAQLRVALKDADELKTAVGIEKGIAKEATLKAQKDAKDAGEANRKAHDAKELAEQLVRQAEGLRLVAESRVVLPDHPTLGLLLAIEGAQRSPRLAAHNNALAAAWSACRERGPVLRANDGDPGSLLSVAFFPDGKRVLLTTMWSVSIWERATGRMLARWHAPITITSSSVSPDGRYVAVTCRDYQLAHYSDGRRILHTDRVAHLWDVATDRHTILKGHENRVVSVCFSPDSKHVLTASWDYTARIWDAATGKTVNILRGHTCPLESASYGPDGRTVFAASTGAKDFSTVPAREFKAGTEVDVPIAAGAKHIGGHGSNTGNSAGARGGDLVRIWDAETGMELKVISSPRKGWASYGPPRARLSPDGRHLCCSLGWAFLLDLKSGQQKQLSLPSFKLPPAFSPDGKYVLTHSSAPAHLCVWEIETAKLVGWVLGHDAEVTSSRFIDDRRIMTTSKDHTCRIWHFVPAEKIEPLATERIALKGHELDVVAADLSPDGRTVLTASADGTARFWNISEQDELGRRLPIYDNIMSTTVRPDGTSVAVGCVDGGVWLLDANTGQRRPDWPAQIRKDLMRKQLLGEVLAVSFSNDGKKLLTVSADPVRYLQDNQGKKTPFADNSPVRIWDVETGVELPLKGGHEATVESAHFSPDGKRVVTVAGSRQKIRIFNDKRALIGQGEMGNDKDRTARVWDSDTGKELFAIQGKWREIGMAVWNHDGSRILTTHEDAVRVWNSVDGTELMQLGQKQRITSAIFSPDGRRLLTWYDNALAHRGTGSWRSLIRWIENQADLWDAATGQHIAIIKGHDATINFAAFSPDGKKIVTTAEDPSSFSSNGRNEDTNFRDRTARIWDAATGKPLQVLRGHLRSVHSASFSKDGKWLVTTSEDRTARIWDLSSGKEFFTLAGHRDAVKSAEFTPDGRFVVTTSWDGAARIWPTDPLPLAVSRKPRELTAEERDRFGIEPGKK